MANLLDAMHVATSGMIAQSMRMNTIASNIANAESVSGSPDTAYKAKVPVFKTVFMDQQKAATGVKVDKIIHSDAPAIAMYRPNHPLADKNGFVYGSNVDKVEQLADMTSAQQSYESDVNVAQASKQLIMQSISILK